MEEAWQAAVDDTVAGLSNVLSFVRYFGWNATGKYSHWLPGPLRYEHPAVGEAADFFGIAELRIAFAVRLEV